jgi:ribonuclease-3
MTPTYEVLETGGTPHDPWFIVAVRVQGHKLAEGRGRSKRLAERAAAASALASFDAPGEPKDP